MPISECSVILMGCGDSKEAQNQVAPVQDQPVVHDNNNLPAKLDLSQNGGQQKTEQEAVVDEKQEKCELEIGTVSELEGHSQYVDLAKWCPNSHTFVSADIRKVILWDSPAVEETVPLKTLDIPSGEIVSCLDWCESGKLLVLGTESGRVYVWTNKGELVTSWAAHVTSGTYCVKMCSDLVLSGGEDVCIYSLDTNTCQLTNWNTSVITDLEWIDENKFLAAEASGAISMDYVDRHSFRTLDEYDQDDFVPDSVPQKQYLSHQSGVYRVSLQPSSKTTFASCSVDCTVKIWHVKKKSPVHTLTGHFGYVTCIKWAGQHMDTLLSASFDGSIRVWDTKSGRNVHTLQEHHDRVSSIDVTSDGLHVASGGHDGSVHFWSVTSGELLTTFEGPGRIVSLHFDANNRLIATSYGAVIVMDIIKNL